MLTLKCSSISKLIHVAEIVVGVAGNICYALFCILAIPSLIAFAYVMAAG